MPWSNYKAIPVVCSKANGASVGNKQSCDLYQFSIQLCTRLMPSKVPDHPHVHLIAKEWESTSSKFLRSLANEAATGSPEPGHLNKTTCAKDFVWLSVWLFMAPAWGLDCLRPIPRRRESCQWYGLEKKRVEDELLTFISKDVQGTLGLNKFRCFCSHFFRLGPIWLI
jgi:hypothetical protein